MLTTVTGIAAKVLIGTVAIGLGGAGAVAAVSATSAPRPASVGADESPVALSTPDPTSDATPEPTEAATPEPEDTPEASESPDPTVAALITRDQAIAIAQGIFPQGTTVKKAKLETEDDERPVWKVTLVADDGARGKFRIDAVDGTVLRQKITPARDKDRPKATPGDDRDDDSVSGRDDDSDEQESEQEDEYEHSTPKPSSSSDDDRGGDDD